jgi:SpoVK/Ycf46/Vps4 family AAA+-type ATPase
MIEAYEQLAIIKQIQNLMKQKLSAHAFKEICDLLETGMPFLGIETNMDKALDMIDEFQNAVRKNNGARPLYRELHVLISQILKKRAQKIVKAMPGSIENNIRTIAQELNLDETEAAFFALIVRYKIHEPLYSLLNNLTRDHMSILELCATCLDVDRKEIAERLRQNSRLLTTGVIESQSRSGKDIDDHFDIPEIISTAMQKTLSNLDDVRKYIIGEPVQPTLEWDDFEHLGATRDKLEKFLREATAKQITGVNILLWGPPGTGKTEFSKTLANRLNLNLYTLGETDDSGDEPNRKERTSAFRIAQNLLRHQKNNLLLFDEMDDLFENKGMAMFFDGKFSTGSKVFTNRLFENNPVPTIWTINKPSYLDESIIRRMALAIEMKVPTPKSRKNVWSRLLAKNEIDVPDETLNSLAEIDVSPGIASNAIKFAGLVGSTLEDFQFATEGIIKATKGKLPLTEKNSSEPYLPELINAETDIGLLADRLSASEAKNFSLCLYGPPGTGKSAYVRYLAERLGMPILFKRASDLMSKYVGENEQNIARAFEEAKEKESFLIFDEADSLLGDRRYAQHSWEISQVNEMLTWMECHPLPFACTTNLKERLDPASMRRFTFKANFDYLLPEQVVIAFKHFFALDLDGRRAKEMRTLTPGDFAVVSKKLQFLDVGNDAAHLIELLFQEVEAKNEIQQRQLGFAVN